MPRRRRERRSELQPPVSPTGIARCGGLLNQAANAAVKAKGSIFEIVYCRTLPRLGHNQAIGAIAHRLGRLIWKILYQRVHHEEPGPAVSKRPKQKRCANDPRTPKRRLSRRTRKSSTGKCRMSAGIFDPVSAFPASCPFRSNMTPPRGLLPRRPHRADFPQRVPQVGLSGYAQGCRIFGGSRGYRRRSAVYLSHVIRFPRGRRLSTSSRSVRRPDRTSEGSGSLSVGRSTDSGLGAWP